GDIFVVTDGQVSGTEAILQEASKRGVRLHCLGIGSASQDRFLSLLARETGGVSRFVTPRERVDAAALELFASVGRPVAVEVRVETSHARTVQIEPPPATAVFEGTPLVIYGQTDGADAAALLISWQREGVPAKLELPLALKPGAEAETARLLRGARLITEAESRLTTAPGRESKSELRAIEKLSRAYGLASRAMALVALVKRPGDRPGEPPQTHVVPVGMPEDTSFGAYFDGAIASVGSPKQPLREMLHCHVVGALPPQYPRQALFFMRSPWRPVDEPTGYTAPAPEFMELGLKLAASIQADGGLPGKDDSERLMQTLVAVLFLLSLEAETGPLFRPHLARLLAFLKAGSHALTGARRTIVERVLDLAERRIAVEGDWFGEASAIVSGRDIRADAFWRKLEQACMPAA
ncbi:MAG: hypothetical protein RMK20_15105, partial [Verrucomicrobiales bacterium]|nr:hypothetical protein [Verrucomicrobiales bacterium]